MSTGLYSGVSGFALGVGLYKGVPGLWGGASGLIAGDGSSLSLDFLTSNTLDPRITFRRTTNATLVDATGRVTYAPNNLVLYSEEFENAAAWSKLGSSITPNTTAAPNGTFTADSLVEDGTTSGHRVAQSISGNSTLTYTTTFYAKLSGRSWARVLIDDSGNGADAYFDLSNGIVGTTASTGTGLFVSASITPAGNGWYRCSLTCKPSNTATGIVRSLISGSTGDAVSAYLGTNGLTSLFIWGAQFEQVTYQTLPSTYVQTVASAYYGPRFDYNPTTLAANGLLIEEQRVNLATNSEAVGLWAGFTGATASSNVAVAPDGTITADKLVESATLNSHFVSQTSASVSYTSGTTYVRSCWLKADGRRYVSLFLPGTNFPATGRSAIFDLQTGVVQAVESGVTATITSFANSWYRCTISAVANATGSGHAGGSALFDNTGQGLYTGDGVSGALIWGAQLEAGAFATSYIPTVASTVTRTVDITSMTGTNFSSWYNQSQGTIVAQFVATTTGVNSTGGSDFPFVYDIDSAAAPTSGNSLLVSAGYGPGWRAETKILGVTQAGLQGAMTLGNASVRKIAYAYQTNNFAASANGGTVLTDTSGTLPSPDRIGIGCQNSDGGNPLTGYIRTLTFYPSRLTDAQLQALTA